MRKIPNEILLEYLSNSFSKKCCFCGNENPQIHHNLIHAGRQVNEVWALLPLCKFCHDKVNNVALRELADWIMYNRATDDELDKYSNVQNHKKRRYWLNIKFGTYSPNKIANHYADIYNKN